MAFSPSIYTGSVTTEESPYQTWLRHCTEKQQLEVFLQRQIPSMQIARTPGRKTVLDIGCSWGSTSFRLMKVLKQSGIVFEYTALDPYPEQLAIFRNTALEQGMEQIHFLTTTLEEAVLVPAYDLVFVSHALYYLPDMKKALEKILAHGKEIIIVHHGIEGIHTIHQAFRDHIQVGANIVSTYWDVGKILQELQVERDFHIDFQAFPSSVDIRCCRTSTDEDGKNLISFFLEKPYADIPAPVREQIHHFFFEKYREEMRHQVGVFVLQRSSKDQA